MKSKRQLEKLGSMQRIISSRMMIRVGIMFHLGLAWTLGSTTSAFPPGNESERQNATTTAASCSSELGPTIFLEIAKKPVKFSDHDEEEKCKEIVDRLTQSEMLIAAGTSYAFWFVQKYATMFPNEVMDIDRVNATKLSAMKEARRHLRAAKGNMENAVLRLKEACRYRKDHNLDHLKTCFDISETSRTDTHDRMQQHILADIHRQPLIIRTSGSLEISDLSCYVIKFPRHSSGTTENEYIITQLYIAERTVAISELNSKGENEGITVVLDVSSYDKKYAPPLTWQFSAAKVLQLLYPERLRKVLIFKPPQWLRLVYSLLRPILSDRSSSKIQMITNILTEGYEGLNLTMPEQDELDHFLRVTPFHCATNDEICLASSSGNRIVPP